MKIETAHKIITENSGGNIDIADFSDLLSNIILEGIKGSIVSDISNIYPLTGGNSGYVFGAKKEGDILKVKKRLLDSQDHIILTDMTKETIDDVYKMFGDDAVEILTTLIKRDLILDQDKEVFNYVRDIMQIKDTLEVSKDDMYNSSLILKEFTDESFMEIMFDLKCSSETMIIASPAVAAIMLRNDNHKPEKENQVLSYIGKIGDRRIFVDFNAPYDYVCTGYCGEESLRGIMFAPYNIMATYHEKYQDGSLMLRINNRYAFSRNVLDNDGQNDSRFFIGAKVNVAQAGSDVGSFIDAFNEQLN